MVCDAGFSIPYGIEVVDVSLGENQPMVVEILNELKKYFSVEKLIMAKETKQISPTLFRSISNVWGESMEVEVIDHDELKQMSKDLKAVIRSGDFTAFGNVILVSGAGNRWYCENQ